VIVLALLVALAAGGGAGWWFLGRGAAASEPKHEKAKPPVFQTLEPFTVNLAEENGEHYLQMSVVYQMADEKAVEQLKTYLPVIRNRILLLLSAKHPSELATPEGKQKLVGELVAAARESLPGDQREGVTSAYLGAFVIQ
jgi:flagellar FliL protein